MIIKLIFYEHKKIQFSGCNMDTKGIISSQMKYISVFDTTNF